MRLSVPRQRQVAPRFSEAEYAAVAAAAAREGRAVTAWIAEVAVWAARQATPRPGPWRVVLAELMAIRAELRQAAAGPAVDRVVRRLDELTVRVARHLR